MRALVPVFHCLEMQALLHAIRTVVNVLYLPASCPCAYSDNISSFSDSPLCQHDRLHMVNYLSSCSFFPFHKFV
eukprot:c39112_g1_i1 orf=123-344(+)